MAQRIGPSSPIVTVPFNQHLDVPQLHIDLNCLCRQVHHEAQLPGPPLGSCGNPGTLGRPGSLHPWGRNQLRRFRHSWMTRSTFRGITLVGGPDVVREFT